MKKVYSKPQILFEDFTLNTNIASGCEIKTRTPAYDQCGVVVSGIAVFINGMTGCEMFPVGKPGDKDGSFGSGNDTICYHVPVGGDNLFNS